MTTRLLVATICGALLIPIASAQQNAPADWYQWRGPNRDGISAESGLLQEWPKSGPPQAWRAAGLGNGYSSFSASGGRLYTLGARAGIEYVIALDRATGKKVWETQNGRRFQNGSTATMVYGVAHLIPYISNFMALATGDIITTGTPPGVGLGHKPPIFLRAGQVVRLGVEGLGEQESKVVPA